MINKVTRHTLDVLRDIVAVCGTCNGKGCASCDWTGTITIIED